MPEPEPGVSPTPDGIQPDQGGKPDGGNLPPGTGQEPSPAPDRPSYEQIEQENAMLRKNYGDSTRSAQQQYQHNQNLAMENERLRREGQPTNQEVPLVPSTGALARAKQLKEAVYAEDESAIAAVLQGVQDDGMAQNQASQQQDTARHQRLQLTWSYLQPHWEGLTNQQSQDPLVARTWQYYASLDQMQNSGQQVVADDAITVPGTETPGVPGSGTKLNIHLLKEAHSRALAESYTPQPQTYSAAQGDVPLEGSGGGTGGPRTPAGDGSDLSLLDEGEKQTAREYFKGTDEEVQQKYFDNLPPRIKKARRSTGRIISESDMLEGDVALGA